MMCSKQMTRLFLRSASVTKDSALPESCGNLSQLAESDARRNGAPYRERHHVALIAAIVCRIWQDRIRMYICATAATALLPTSPRLKRGMTFGVGRRSGNSSALNHCVHCGLHAGWCFAVGPRSTGNLRFAFSSVAEGRRCSACSTYVCAMR